MTIATFAGAGRRLLPDALSDFVGHHPEVELTILEAEPEESLPAVREGRVDLAIAYHFDGPPPARPGDRSGLGWTPLGADPLRVVLPARHPAATRQSPLHLAELAHQRWILGCHKFANQLTRYAELVGVGLRISCTATDYDFAQSLVRAGVGIALIPEIGLARHPELVSLSHSPSRARAAISAWPSPAAVVATPRGWPRSWHPCSSTNGPYGAARLQARRVGPALSAVLARAAQDSNRRALRSGPMR